MDHGEARRRLICSRRTSEPTTSLTDERRASLLSLSDPFAEARNDRGFCDARAARRERWRWIVFHRELDLLCLLNSDQLSCNMQTEIDAGRDPAAGDEIAIDDNPALVRDRPEPAEKLARSPMGGCTPARKQAGGTEQERSGTHRGDEA